MGGGGTDGFFKGEKFVGGTMLCHTGQINAVLGKEFEFCIAKKTFIAACGRKAPVAKTGKIQIVIVGTAQ